MGNMDQQILGSLWSGITPLAAFLAQSAMFVWLVLSGHLVTRKQHESELKAAILRGDDFKAALDKQDAVIEQKDSTITEKDRQIARLIDAQHATTAVIKGTTGA